jgi:hypothetical protein
MVTGADRWLAAAGLPFRYGDAGVARDDLSVAVRPEPGRAAPGAAALSAHGSGDALSAGQAPPPGPRPAARHPPYQPATRRGGRPGGARALGRRPGLRPPAERGGDPGRAPQPLCAVVSAARGSDRSPGAASTDHRHPPTAPTATPLAYLGPRPRDGRAHPVHYRLGRPGLFLRPTQPLAARHQRKPNGLLRQYLPKSSDLRRFDQTAWMRSPPS